MNESLHRSNYGAAAYRCVVAPERSRARIRVGKKRYLVTALFTSRIGFTIQTTPQLAKKLRYDRVYTLEFGGEVWEVFKESQYQDGDMTQVGLTRGKEKTKLRQPSTSIPIFLSKRDTHSDTSFLMYLCMILIVACIALPGIGDSLGTAPRIQRGLQMLFASFRDFF
ncbi:MAG: hypothetical protein AAGG44_03570 [Planctomycetota bacterium]